MRQGLVLSGVLASAKAGMASWIVLAGFVTAGATAGVVALTRGVPEAQAPVVAPKVEAPRPAKAAPPPEPARAAPALPVPDEVAKPASAASPAASSGDLREEIALLDQARAAVRGGDAQKALALLALHQRRFPRGEFRQEVTVLRIEALAGTGQAAAAATLGKKFLAAHPESPHAERIERLIGAGR
jgi:TolA-binding protein